MTITDIISPMIEELNCYCNILVVANGKTYLKISYIDKSLTPILRSSNRCSQLEISSRIV